MKKDRITKNDLRLIFVLFLLGLLSVAFVTLWPHKAGTQLIITVNNESYGIYDLSQDEEIPIKIDGKTGNVLKIKDGQAKMISATCPDRLCVHQKAISRQGETIVCLPHKLIVEIQGQEAEAALDGLAK